MKTFTRYFTPSILSLHVGFFLLVISGFVNDTTWQYLGAIGALGELSKYLGFGLLCLSILLDNPLRVPVAWILGIVLAVASFRFGGGALLIGVFLVLSAAGRKDLRPLTILILASYVLLTFPTIFAAKSGIIQNLVRPTADGTVIREALGFTHPNSFGKALVVITIAAFAILNNRNWKSWFGTLLLGLITAWAAYSIAYSRTAAFTIVVSTGFFLSLPLLRRCSNIWIRVILVFNFLVVFGLSMWPMLAYTASSSSWVNFNSIVSNRFFIASEYYQLQGISLFGSPSSFLVSTLGDQLILDNTGMAEMPLDNAFAFLYIRVGAVVSTILIGGIFVSLIRVDKSDYTLPLGLALVCFGFAGFTETYTFSIETNFGLLLMVICYDQGQKDLSIKNSVE